MMINETKKLIPTFIDNSSIVGKLQTLCHHYYNDETSTTLSEEDKLYYNKYGFSLSKYQYYEKTYKTYLDNKNIFDLLSNIHNNCNIKCNNCNNCNNNNKLIADYISTNNYNFDFNIKKIIEKYNKYKRLYKIHKIYNNIKYTQYMEFIDNLNKHNEKQLCIFNEKNNYCSTEISKLENIIIHIQNTIIKLDIQDIQNSNYHEYEILQEQLLLYNDIKTKIKCYENELTDINNKIKLFDTYKNISHTNDTNKLLFEELTLQINDNDQLLLNYNNDIIKFKIQLDKLNSSKTIYMDLITQLNILEKDKNIFTHINKLADSNGLPLLIIQNKLKYIQDGVSNMLYKIIKKRIIITDDTTNIYIDIVNEEGRHSSYFGGMEFFICTLCFKILLCSILNIPFSGILFIDEGVSALDKEHIDNFHIVIDFLKEYYSKVLLITHIKDFKNFTCTNINIKSVKHSKDNYVSQLNFT